MRKPVGVLMDPTNGDLIVVCDDGSVWRGHIGYASEPREWIMSTPIPGTAQAEWGKE